jgi:HAD superfamily hydrolase (TIGR01509 family)
MPDQRMNQIALPEALIFDLDGTLVDTVQDRISAWERALAEAGYPVGRERLRPMIGVDGIRLATAFAAQAGVVLDGDAAEQIDRRCGELFREIATLRRPLPGVRELIGAIERSGRPWAIATSSRKAEVGPSIDALGLDNEPRIVDASQVAHAKPEPDLLLQAAKQLDVDPERCWYIGDSTWDMVSAVAASMVPIGMTAGSAVDAVALYGAGAAAVVERLDAITARIARQ